MAPRQLDPCLYDVYPVALDPCGTGPNPAAADPASAVLPFGKFAGCTLAWLADNQLGYLRWLDTVPWLAQHPEFEEAFIAFREANPMLFVRL